MGGRQPEHLCACRSSGPMPIPAGGLVGASSTVRAGVPDRPAGLRVGTGECLEVAGGVRVPVAREATSHAAARAPGRRDCFTAPHARHILEDGNQRSAFTNPDPCRSSFPFPTRQDATATNRVSLITVTLIWPGYCKVSWICSAMSRPSSTQPLSSMSLGCTSTRSSRPACRA